MGMAGCSTKALETSKDLKIKAGFPVCGQNRTDVERSWRL